MTIEAKIVEDSISPTKARLTTFQLRYPRFIHSEFMTHRVFSRNASSSRAIPVKRSIAMTREDPAMFVHWGMNQPGMQAEKEMDAFTIEAGKTIWLQMMEDVMRGVEILNDMGFHKQLVNRALEPWSHISVVVTATEWDNFLSLRCHPDAQPEFKVLAGQMRDLYFFSIPRSLEIGDWHLPYIRQEEYVIRGYDATPRNQDELIKASIARCARVSYLTHDKEEPSLEKDVVLHDRLLSSRHLSPFEHIATPNADPAAWSGNFQGWVQYRKTIKGENYNNYSPPETED